MKALGGGAQVTSGQPGSVALQQSYPSSTNVWTAIGTVLTTLTGGNAMTVKAYVICQ
jgi:hypothetical protein